jgi:outer membrane protein OmpA-like peptidoglycan-associated protein
VVKGDRIEILEKVFFETGSAVIKEESYGLLDDVAKVLVDHPNILKVEIGGHTDSQGSAGYNRRLSQSRSDSVREYLIKANVAAGRLTARGYGEDTPIADNGTEEGRSENRRVEFRILKQKPKREPPQ